LKEDVTAKPPTATSDAEVKGIKPIEQDLDAIGKNPLKEDVVEMEDENAEGSKSDASESDDEGSEDEGEETKLATVALGSGDWDDAN
jgi:hypothetical protein